eukprot:TCONS_00072880-protein
MCFFGIFKVFAVFTLMNITLPVMSDRRPEESTILKKPQKVLLVSIDGFRWDLHKITDTPNIDRVIKNGITVDHVLNVFPTKTLPNHQSIVTGLFPEHHGMIDNDFIDKDLGATFSLENQKCMEDPKFWQQSLPIWIQVQRQTKYNTGNLFWPGYKVPYKNYNLFFNGTPAYHFKDNYYNETSTYLPSKSLQFLYEKGMGDYNKTFYKLIDQAVEWLAQDDVIFVPLYSMEPDLTLHESGVEHKDVKKQIEQLDQYVGFIYDNITRHPALKDQVNVIFIGDHGHVTTSADRMIDLSKLVNITRDIEGVFGFTNVFLYTMPNKTRKVYEQLKSKADKSTLFRVFLKENIPKYLHIGDNSRTGDILILPEPGWIVVDKTRLPDYLKEPDWVRSEHGYDSMNRDMSPGFFAFGPMFKKCFKKFCIKTVDLYELMCKILGISPDPNDGKFDRVKPLLIKNKNRKAWKSLKDNVYEDWTLDGNSYQNNLTMNGDFSANTTYIDDNVKDRSSYVGNLTTKTKLNNGNILRNDDAPSLKDFSKRYEFIQSQTSKRMKSENGNIRFEIKYDNDAKERTINGGEDDDDYDSNNH